ncbi:MAG: YceI family protein [Alphaproteobacteria bacterium]|nr:YceI family protein [Alphaproteobacteria bacterium]
MSTSRTYRRKPVSSIIFKKLCWTPAFAGAFALLLLFPLTAHAMNWEIAYPMSKLSFEGTQTGTPFTGNFSVFQASVNFDPKKPDSSRIEVNIDVRSAKTGDKDRDQALPGKDWFNSSAIPFAQLNSTKVRKLSDKKFELTALLTLKDITHEVVLPFSMEDERDAQRIKGELTINRMDYGIGVGTWANETYVKNAVKIKIDLLARPVP